MTVKLILRAITDEEAQQPGRDILDAVCVAICERQPNQKVAQLMHSFADGQLSASSWPTRVATSGESPARHRGFGRSWSAIPKGLPALERLDEFSNQVYNQLMDHAKRTVNVLRWRLAATGHAHVSGQGGYHWSVDGEHWHPMWHRGQGYMQSGPSLGDVSTAIIQETVAIVEAGFRRASRPSTYSRGMEHEFPEPPKLSRSWHCSG